jgi:hypothetical protein
MIYINADTLDYPRYEGDLLLEPNANWQIVKEVIEPMVTDNLHIAEEVAPIFVDGKWQQNYVIREKTSDEILENAKPTKAQLFLLENDEA